MWSHPTVYRYISGKPSTPEQSWMRILTYSGHWELLGYGFWAVEEKATGTFAGELGFADFKRDVDPPVAVPEAGWVFDPAMHGRGYALEALRAALAWADDRFEVPAISAIIAPANAASLRLAGKAGFVERAETIYRGDALTLLARPRYG